MNNKKWFMALAQAWKEDKYLLDAIATYYELERDPVTKRYGFPENYYDELGLRPHTKLAQPVRGYIARRYVMTSNAMWDGKFVTAWKWFKSDKDHGRHEFATTEAKREFRKDAGYKVIRARAMDKRHDWKTVK